MPARTIAVVDDDDDVRTSLSRLLRARGFAVRLFGSGEAFLERAPADLPDCLVLDIRLAGMSGLELRAQLLARGVPAPVVFITALDDRATMETLRGQAVTCLLKPVEEAALLDAIASAMTDKTEELVDVVDEEDRVVATVARREIRARDLLHRCTYVLVRNASGEILVHRRTDTKDIHPGAYDVFAGGVCAAGESYDACARREVAEELGVAGAELRFLFRHRYRGPRGQAWGAVYETRWDGPLQLQASEVGWGAWVSPERLQLMLTELDFCPDSREILARLPIGGGVAGERAGG